MRDETSREAPTYGISRQRHENAFNASTGCEEAELRASVVD